MFLDMIELRQKIDELLVVCLYSTTHSASLKRYGPFSHKELETVIQGSRLVEPLVNTEEDLRDYIAYSQYCTNLITLDKSIKEFGWKHGQ